MSGGLVSTISRSRLLALATARMAVVRAFPYVKWVKSVKDNGKGGIKADFRGEMDGPVVKARRSYEFR